jgi:uncharacterized protein
MHGIMPEAMPRTEELRISAGDATTLVGTLTLPDAPPPAGRRGRYPNVLLLGSWLPRSRDGGYDRAGHPSWFAPGRLEPPGLLARLAGALGELGVASLRYDPRGCGRSDGKWAETALFARIDDARDALGHLRSRSDLDLARAGIAGHGEGASIAMSVAIGDPAIGALTLFGGTARSFRDVLRRAVAERARRREAPSHPILLALDRASEELIERAERLEPAMVLRVGDRPLRLDLRGWQQAFATPPFALATMLHRSVSLVHGADDDWSSPDESRLLEAALLSGGNRPALRLIEDAGHELSETPDRTVEELAADLAGRLLPRALPPVLLAIEESASNG